MRNGTVRMDRANTSIIAGQDKFFAPLAPSSLASLAVPPLAYAGNLWDWVPQVRIEHRIDLRGGSNLNLQGGIVGRIGQDLLISGPLANQETTVQELKVPAFLVPQRAP